MKRARGSRGDVVIGMTLAEVFLLLLVVGWYGARLESEATKKPGDARPALVSTKEFERAERLRLEAEGKLARKTRDYEQLERILSWIAQTAGLPKTIQSLDDAKKAVEVIRVNAKRGKAACDLENVLVDVNAQSGVLTATTRRALTFGSHNHVRGEQLDQDRIDSFLRDVDAFYALEKSESGKDCVFDFTLTWRTDADYRKARELFEQHFYPAGIRQLK
jgi:hypothetical protein